MSANKWDERYQSSEYIFGTAPNTFIAEVLPLLPKSGKALDMATGEGRNGIFLAEHGLDVEGVDLSSVGLAKAAKLAKEKGVAFTTTQQDLTTYTPPVEQYSVITSVFCHFAEPQRSQILPKWVNALAQGGMFAGVFYHPDQLNLGTGGPSNPAMLADITQLQNAMSGLEWLIAEYRRPNLEEGSRHRGESAIICLLGRKP